MKGVTLIEMIIVLSLIAIICLFAIPSFQRQADEGMASIAQTQLLQQLQNAQQVANAKMVSVAVCLSHDGKTCVASDGAMVLTFIDSKADGVLHDDEQLISSVFLKGSGSLRLRSYPTYRNYILVLPSVVSKSDNGTFWYCKDDAVQWAVTVSQSGEPHVVDKPDEALACG